MYILRQAELLTAQFRALCGGQLSHAFGTNDRFVVVGISDYPTQPGVAHEWHTAVVDEARRGGTSDAVHIDGRVVALRVKACDALQRTSHEPGEQGVA